MNQLYLCYQTSFLSIYGEYKNYKQLWYAHLILFILGIMLPLGFPPYNLILLVIISFVLSSLIFAKITKLWQCITMAVAYSAGIVLSGLYWIYTAIDYILQNMVLSFFAMVGFLALYSVFILCITFFIYFMPKKEKLFIIFIFIGSSTAEVAKYYLFGGFPWLIFALFWDFSLEVQQVAYIIGSFGISIATIGFLSSVLVFWVKPFKLYLKISIVSFFAFMIFLFYIYGYVTLSKKVINDNKKIQLRLVQGIISQKERLDSIYFDKVFNEMVDLAFKDLDKLTVLPKYIILPEVVFPSVFDEKHPRFAEIANKIPKGSYLLFGALREENNHYYNTFYIVSGDSKGIVGVYDKMKLVPFGEYMPFGKLSPAVEKITGLQSMTPGDVQTVFNLGNDTFTVLICFEGVFAGLIPKQKGLDFILNISNEAWFDYSIELSQYVSLLRYRSIENRTFVLKSSNAGYSVIFDEYGRIVYKSNPKEATVLDITVHL